MFSKAGSVICKEKKLQVQLLDGCHYSNVAQEEQGAKYTALKNITYNFGFTGELTIYINLLISASKITAKPVQGSTINTEFTEF